MLKKNRKDTTTYRELEILKIISTRESNNNQNFVIMLAHFDTSPKLSQGYKGGK